MKMAETLARAGERYPLQRKTRKSADVGPQLHQPTALRSDAVAKSVQISATIRQRIRSVPDREKWLDGMMDRLHPTGDQQFEMACKPKRTT